MARIVSVLTPNRYGNREVMIWFHRPIKGVRWLLVTFYGDRLWSILCETTSQLRIRVDVETLCDIVNAVKRLDKVGAQLIDQALPELREWCRGGA